MLSLVPQIFPVKKKVMDFIRKIKELPTISNCDVSDFAAMGFSAILYLLIGYVVSTLPVSYIASLFGVELDMGLLFVFGFWVAKNFASYFMRDLPQKVFLEILIICILAVCVPLSGINMAFLHLDCLNCFGGFYFCLLL